MFNKGQLAGLMKQAQAMQDNLKKAQEELGHIEVTGESGSGMVQILMTCKHQVKRRTKLRERIVCWHHRRDAAIAIHPTVGRPILTDSVDVLG